MKDQQAIKVFTVGYGGKGACQFFELLKQAEARKVVDVRLYNTSQLAGYAKRDDLAYFVQTIIGGEYVHLPELAPTKQILDDYKQGVIDWAQYETAFNELIEERRIETVVTPERVDRACFLCAETKRESCEHTIVSLDSKSGPSGILKRSSAKNKTCLGFSENRVVASNV